MNCWNVNETWFKLYINACVEASLNNDSFNNFKSDSRYQLILEHVNYEQGLSYLNEIKKNKEIYNHLHLFCINDSIGNASTYKYEEYYISPSTLRYVKVLCDLYNLFGDLSNSNICEIGCGYGGQCKILDLFYNIQSYTLVDLQEVNALSNKYLNTIGIKTDISHLSHPIKPDKNYDLVISNYAFSELPIHIQENYLDSIITKSTSGYITFNNSQTSKTISYHIEDIAKLIPNSKIIEEIPQTGSDNKILYWL